MFNVCYVRYKALDGAAILAPDTSAEISEPRGSNFIPLSAEYEYDSLMLLAMPAVGRIFNFACHDEARVGAC